MRIVSLIVAGIAGLLGLSILFGSWYTVPEGHRGVITRNGAVIGIAEPGLGFKLPIIDSVRDMSIQTQKAEFPDVVSYSRDIQQATSRITVNYSLNPAHVLDVYSTVGVDYAEKLVIPVVYKRVKEVFGDYTAADVVAKREQLGTDVLEAVRSGMSNDWVRIESIQIENIDFSEAYEAAVEAAAKAEADVKRARQELEQVKVNAQRQVAEAEARATATKMAADAEAYATRARGEAEAAAIAARGRALRDNPDLVQLIAAERWNGVLPTTMLPGSATPFVNIR
jgi:regulator of protease activity HflC (stomatin/prohibitin superfamily)